ncbi:hook-length control protein FliK [Bosea sp. CRIB-10]|uniref:flagellar hook-length control protein FliK n=1 Tax=Bosea sp. CRIB-10 TaxID=378404 RepID=UPI0008F1AFA9|nr:flagellar hook-length control protein FliK [Bosea sp. CRIB-10]SFC37213.1 hook-length control protein FliK [Bosea sp. CRIB-10]
MSAAPVSRSSALPEIPLPNRRAPERSEPEQAFSLPEEPVEQPRARRDDDRAARESAETGGPSKPEDGARKTAAEGNSPARASEPGKESRTADAKEQPGKPKDGAGAELATPKAAPVETEQAKAAASSKPAEGKIGDENQPALAAPLESTPVIDKVGPDEQLVAGAVTQPVPVPVLNVAAEFLVLAALTLQGAQPAKPEGAATPEGKPEGQTVAASVVAVAPAQAVPGGLAVPMPAAPVKADGQASTGGEVAVAGGKAGLTPQLLAAGIKTKAGLASGEAPPSDAKTADAQTMPQDGGEAGKGAPIALAGEVKVSEAATASQPAPAGAPDAAASAANAQPTSAPLSPQAILAAGPQSLIQPQVPLTELDAAAQATAHAQAEAAHKMPSGDSGRATPLHVVPVEIGAQALAGNKRFDIRLDPAELGRIDVRLEISDKGEVSAKLTVDRVETLHMLQRDARTLERAFEQAGLKPSEGGIDMSLRDQSDQSGARQQQRHENESQHGRRAWVQISDDSALVTEVANLPRNASRLGGVDLSI